ncbi:unnamed protein product [Coccothraustes coccothraustes]
MLQSRMFHYWDAARWGRCHPSSPRLGQGPPPQTGSNVPPAPPDWVRAPPNGVNAPPAPPAPHPSAPSTPKPVPPLFTPIPAVHKWGPPPCPPHFGGVWVLLG